MCVFFLAATLPEISKIIGDEWKKLNEEAKQVSLHLEAILYSIKFIQDWMEKAKVLRLDYEIEVHNFKRQLAEQNGVPMQPPKPSKKKATPSSPSVGEKRTSGEANQSSAKKQ